MSKPGFNGRRYIVDIPGSAGAFLPILAPGPTRYVKAVESLLTSTGAPNVVQGFNYLIPNDGTAPGYGQALSIPPNVVLELGDPPALSRADQGSLLGNGPGVLIGIGATPATELFAAKSATATATSIEISFYF